MMQQFKRVAAAMLAAMLVMSGCAAAPAPAQDKPSADAAGAMGRYIESEVVLPDGAGYILSCAGMPDGSIELLCNLDKSKAEGPWKLFRSTDSAQSWAEQAVPWLARYDAVMPESVSHSNTGDWYFYYQNNSGEARVDKLEKIDAAGNVTELSADFPKSAAVSSVRRVAATDSGDLLLVGYNGILQVDAATMKLKNEYVADSNSVNIPFITYDNTLVLSTMEEIQFYDLTTGEKVSASALKELRGFVSNTSTTGDRKAGRVFALDAGHALYIGDKSGLYRQVEGGVVLERLADGEMTSLNMPALAPTDLIACADGSVLLLFTVNGAGFQAENEHQLLRYRYSADTPTVPARELRVYSLYNNQTILQTIGLFQRQNPDAHVVYTVGVPGDGSVLPADALRTLSAELLAGKGPDLLVLDGMPLDAYIEKGVLLDLSETVAAKTVSGELLRNPANAFKRTDGTAYAIPARFTVPLLVAGEDAAGKLSDLTALADYLVGKKTTHAEEYSVYYRGGEPLSLIAQFYPLCAAAWQADDGSIKEDVFRAFLTDLKKIYDLEPRQQGEGATFSTHSITDAVLWANGVIPLATGNLLTFGDLPVAIAATAKMGGSIEILNGQSGGTFLPATNLGINAQSTAQADALAFLALALSEQVQKKNFSDGLPVNAAAFTAGLKNPFADPNDSINYGSGMGGEFYALEVRWPSEAAMNEVADKIKALERAFSPDETVQMLLYNETADFFLGKKSLDDTVTAFTTKYKLYLAE